MRKLISVMVVYAFGALAAGTVTGPAGAQGSNKKTMYVSGAFETKGESPVAIPNYDDGAKLAVKDLQKQGWDVTYERTPASGTIS